MDTEQLLKRINELARKKKSEGLTDEELNEQSYLREQYLIQFRGSFEQVVKTVDIVSEMVVPVEQVEKEKLDIVTAMDEIVEIKRDFGAFVITYKDREITEEQIRTLLGVK